jgi:hypothetical protein
MMTLTDCVGFLGVSILLIAYFLSSKGIVKQDSILYISMNLVGAGIACFAAIMMNYIPFIILEGAWSFVSFLALIQTIRKTRIQL